MAAVPRLVASGFLKAAERIVIFNTGTGFEVHGGILHAISQD